MTEQTKMQLEQTHILIESQWPNILYCIAKDGKGLYICSGKAYETILPIATDNVEGFLEEVREVWELHKVR
jgi:hypothetical protein